MTAQRKAQNAAGSVKLVVEPSAEKGLTALTDEAKSAVLGVLAMPGEGRIHHVKVRGASEPGDSSGWFEVVYDVVLEGDWAAASKRWRQLSDALESVLDELSPETQRQLIENVAIHVSEYDAD